ncbi:MAG TPA: hypothetical protein VFS23_07090 [Vicinamibacterales bacterium]|nr:hypothetical protein [Vicinamibacterales bacterium]
MLQALRFRRTPKEEADDDEKVIEMLGKSPYRDKLADTALMPVIRYAEPLNVGTPVSTVGELRSN